MYDGKREARRRYYNSRGGHKWHHQLHLHVEEEEEEAVVVVQEQRRPGPL
jgi:hypothetical protein